MAQPSWARLTAPLLGVPLTLPRATVGQAVGDGLPIVYPSARMKCTGKGSFKCYEVWLGCYAFPWRWLSLLCLRCLYRSLSKA